MKFPPPHGRNPNVFDGPCECEDCNQYRTWLPVAAAIEDCTLCDCGHELHEPWPCDEWRPNHHFGGGLDKPCHCPRWERV